MTGEMSAAEVTRDNYPELFALRDALRRRGIKSEPRPFDQYQGPYLNVPGVGSVWYSQDENAAAVKLRRQLDGSWKAMGPVFAGGLWTIEARRGGGEFQTLGAHHVHAENGEDYAAGCYTLRQAARRIASIVGMA
jgi:hypothetical protein